MHIIGDINLLMLWSFSSGRLAEAGDPELLPALDALVVGGLGELELQNIRGCHNFLRIWPFCQ